MLKFNSVSWIFVFFLLFSSTARSAPQEQSTQQHWLSSWYSPIDSVGPALPAQSIRQWLRTSIGGEQLRLHFSNRFGEQPLVLTSVSITYSSIKSKDKLQGYFPVRFSGLGTVIINPGEEIVSDPVDMKTTALQQLAISFYLPAGASNSSIHSTALQNSLTVEQSDLTREARWPRAKLDDTRYFLTNVEVLCDDSARVIVAVGDSITDGVGIADDTYHRWTDVLAERLQENPKYKHFSVINAGIAGNRVLRGSAHPFVGEAAIKRFEQDALLHSHLHAVLFLQGTNDILANTLLSNANENVTASQLIEGIKQLIAKTHAKGVQIYGATILPRGGSTGIFTHTKEAEEMRVYVNHWIRTSKAFDAVFDFDALLRDPEQTDRLQKQYDSGDHTHPNAAGYRAMAQAIRLEVFKVQN